jgi:mono/diheme cytochrome c family protein
MVVKAFLRALLVLVVIGSGLAGAVLYSLARRGLSTRAEPTRAEELMARAMRRLATPGAVRTRPNPVEPTQVVLEEALTHFADHCASCHGNDGSGDTSIGRSFYPKAPDMRASATQSLSDGELFSIIENGIRLTGMPAWGDGTVEGERASWGLVHFVRQLPTLTPETIERMEGLNPRTPAEFREAEDARRFLAGDDPLPESAASPLNGHGH